MTATAHTSRLRVRASTSHLRPGPQKPSTCAQSVQFTTASAHIDGPRTPDVARATEGAHGRPACAPVVATGGRADGRTCGRADVRTCRQTGGRTCGRAACGRADGRTCRQTGGRTCGRTCGVRAGGRAWTSSWQRAGRHAFAVRTSRRAGVDLIVAACRQARLRGQDVAAGGRGPHRGSVQAGTPPRSGRWIGRIGRTRILPWRGSAGPPVHPRQPRSPQWRRELAAANTGGLPVRRRPGERSRTAR
jgi:hypothetical protein